MSPTASTARMMSSDLLNNLPSLVIFTAVLAPARPPSAPSVNTVPAAIAISSAAIAPIIPAVYPEDNIVLAQNAEEPLFLTEP